MEKPRLTRAVSGAGFTTITPGPGAVERLVERLAALDVAAAAEALDTLVERGALVGDVDQLRAEISAEMVKRHGPAPRGVHEYFFRPGGRTRPTPAT